MSLDVFVHLLLIFHQPFPTPDGANHRHGQPEQLALPPLRQQVASLPRSLQAREVENVQTLRGLALVEEETSTRARAPRVEDPEVEVRSLEFRHGVVTASHPH